MLTVRRRWKILNVFSAFARRYWAVLSGDALEAECDESILSKPNWVKLERMLLFCASSGKADFVGEFFTEIFRKQNIFSLKCIKTWHRFALRGFCRHFAALKINFPICSIHNTARRTAAFNCLFNVSISASVYRLVRHCFPSIHQPLKTRFEFSLDTATAQFADRNRVMKI